jgi:hypothetical protein
MMEVITAIQNTPIPTILILGGLLFILLGFVTKLGGIIEVSTEQKRLAIPVGLLVLTIGLLFRYIPSEISPNTTSDREKPNKDLLHWSSYQFPPPNGGLLFFTIMPDGNPACASYDGGNCLWGNTYDQIDFGKLKPLVCGAEHRTRWGVTGYENPQHWCNLALKVSANPSQ